MIRDTAQRVADAAPAVQAALDNVSTRFTDAEARLNEARADVASTMDRIWMMITVVALLIIALLVYIAALHVVLLRVSGGLRKTDRRQPARPMRPARGPAPRGTGPLSCRRIRRGAWP